MDKLAALAAFSALGQETRLDVFRLLVNAGTEGMLSGDIGTTIGTRQNTMSANLTILRHAGLVRSERQGRSIRYFADMEGLKGLLGYLLEDCCGGKPSECQPLINAVADATVTDVQS